MRTKSFAGLLLLLAKATCSGAVTDKPTSKEVRKGQGIDPSLKQPLNAVQHSQTLSERFNQAVDKWELKVTEDVQQKLFSELDQLNAELAIIDSKLDYADVRLAWRKYEEINERWMALHAHLQAKVDADPNRLDPNTEYAALESQSDRMNLEQNAKMAEIVKVDALLAEPKQALRAVDRRIVAKRLEMRKAGIKIPPRTKITNYQTLDNLPEVMVRTKLGKVFLGSTIVGVVGVVAVVAYFLVEKYAPWIIHDTPSPATTQQRIDIIKKQSKPENIIKDQCTAMHDSVSQLEQIAQESSSAVEWNAHLDVMGPVFQAAYAQTNAAGVKEINGREIVNWGAPAASPIAAIIPVHASAIQRQTVEDANAQAQEHWSFNEFLRPISIQFELAEEHRNNIHETAFSIIRNSTGFGFATDSNRFNQVYAAYFGRVDIPGGCFKYFKEPKAIHAQYKDAREELAIYESDTQNALDFYFEARSALPETPPLPSVTPLKL